jgi:NAD(P)-dependent dehydrogenase (short-subunit alcohol dehydrogenase family)
MIASTASHAGAPYVAAYTASKHAVLGLTRAIAAEVAGTGVTANAVCPTFTRTDMTERTLWNIMEKTGRTAEAAAATLTAQSPLGRLLEPEEVAAAVAYLVSDSARAVNGQSLVLDGGGVQL